MQTARLPFEVHELAGTSEVPAMPLPPLDGITVLDLSRVLAGPYAAMMLADLGARVIKVERPRAGDDTRQWGPPFVGEDGARESTYYLSINRNKESVELDLKDDADREVLKALVADADVLIENFRPGVMERLGLGARGAERINPRLVMLSISGFGRSGPDSGRTGYDQILQAEGGLMSITGHPGGEPTKVGVPIADMLAGMFGAFGVLAALRERDAVSGRGQVGRDFVAGRPDRHPLLPGHALAGRRRGPRAGGQRAPDGLPLWPVPDGRPAADHRGRQRRDLEALRAAGRPRPRGARACHQRPPRRAPRQPRCRRSAPA